MVIGMEDNEKPDMSRVIQSLLELREALLNTVNVINQVVQSNQRRGITLMDIGNNKINIIKVIREFTSWGLKESKDAAETPQMTFFVADAEKMASRLRAAGAEVWLCDGKCDICELKYKCYTTSW